LDVTPAFCQTLGGTVTGNTPCPASTRFLTIFEAATIMRVSKRTVYRLIRAGDLQAVKVSGSYRIPGHALEPQASFLSPKP
jgi:excisionase family DNA binding protein